jgi:chromate transporter
MDDRLLGLFLVFAPLSLLSFGGGQAIVADIQIQTVEVRGYLSNQEFADMFAISRAAPGPSTLIAALIGYQVAGFAGALVACFAIYLPSSLLVYGVANWWQRNKTSPLKTAIERGLAPVAVGLIFAGAVAVIRSANVGPLEIATIALCCALFYLTKVSPYLVVLSAAAAYGVVHFVLTGGA